MKFIRDIINEKKHAAGADEASAPRMPLALTPEYRSHGAAEAAMTDADLDQPVDAPGAAGERDDAGDGLIDALHSLGFDSEAGRDWAEDELEDDLEDSVEDDLEAAPALSWDDPAEEDVGEDETLEEEVFGADIVKELMETARSEEPAEDRFQHARPFGDAERPATDRPERRPFRGMQASAGAAVKDQQPAPETARPHPEAPRETPVEMVKVPSPAAGRGVGSSGRVKTRLLGFGTSEIAGLDPILKKDTPAPAAYSSFPVGWLIVIEGPGKGAAFTLYEGLSQIGRAEGQTVQLSFGDNSISRENHAAIAYDAERRCFYFGHGGKANLVRLNGRPVLSTEELPSESDIRIGETTLRFIALCGQNFSWGADQQEDTRHAVRG